MEAYGDHPNLLRLYHTFEAKDTLTLVLQLADGDLCDRIMETGPLDVETARLNLGMLVSGLKRLHTCGWAHRDLKPDNILTVGQQLVISDFGLANRAGESGMLETPCGTESYAAPEVIDRSPYCARRPTSSRWVWCCTS